jgi:hypothetical protein
MSPAFEDAVILIERYRWLLAGMRERSKELRLELERRGVSMCAGCRGEGTTVCTDPGCGKDNLHVCDLKSCAPCRGTGLAL